MFNVQNLREFLVKAKKATYAAGDSAQKTIGADKSTTLIFEDGDWKYHDNYFGGEPYGGREVVFFQGSPVYIMIYYGWVNDKIPEFAEVYKTLQQALLLIPADKPYRGPERYENGEYLYVNNFVGEVDNFSGEEIITYNGEEAYRAKYMGGLVDQRR
jgi:hypothetical protein